MDQTIDIRALEEAVLIFYRSSSTEQAQAHDWLQRAQNHIQAWSFVWELMEPTKVGGFVVVFFSCLCASVPNKLLIRHCVSLSSHQKYSFSVLPHSIRN